MASLIQKLSQQSTWLDYLAYKRANAQLNKREEAQLAEFVSNKAWLPVTERLLKEGSSSLSIPEKKHINRFGKSSKRVVYSFPDDEQQVLKLLAWLLYEYDDVQPQHCYSFRRGTGAHKAIRHLTSLPSIDSFHCYKLDVQDYFNSINVARLLPMLEEVFCKDPQLYQFFATLLQTDQARCEEEVITEKRGVMAGTPTAPFLANLYLAEMDGILSAQATAYARYSDDIIMFSESAAHTEELRAQAHALLASFDLKVNPEKEFLSFPGESWDFLGIAYKQGTIDLSSSTQRKLKGKIRRKARALRRWMLRKETTPERATAAMIRSMNRKFYDRGNTHDLTWSRWFFPLITTSESLAKLDAYLQQELRTITTGRHNKTNYRVSYAQLKKWGYRSLVHEYYQMRRASHN